MTTIPKPSVTAAWEHYGGRVFGSPNGSGWQKATCVLHEDSSPSASVNEDECRWHCWTCDVGGDVVDLIQRREGCDFRAATAAARVMEGGEHDADTDSSLLVRRTNRRPGRNNWTPPWTR